MTCRAAGTGMVMTGNKEHAALTWSTTDSKQQWCCKQETELFTCAALSSQDLCDLLGASFLLRACAFHLPVLGPQMEESEQMTHTSHASSQKTFWFSAQPEQGYSVLDVDVKLEKSV